MAVEPGWYAIHVYPQNEKKVTADLERRGITTFLPLRGERHRWSDRDKTVHVPLFPCYAFVRMVPSPQLRSAILQTRRVIRLLSANDEPTPIPDAEIDSIRSLLSGGVQVSPHEFLRADQKVRIRGGCLDGIEGVLVVRNGERNLVMSVNLIQRSFMLSIDGYQVEPI